ncbi:MAG: hypothetical protein ABSD59_03630 [Terracidiphilus sp.]|jgi:hypothetical protein
MSDRREFLKGAGFLGLASWSGTLPAPAQEPKPAAEDARGTKADRSSAAGTNNIVLENAEMRLEISRAGVARSLLHKASGQECLAQDVDVPMFALTQDRPYDNELQLSYPAEVTHFPGNQVTRQGDQLTMEFAVVDYKGTVEIRITDAYIAFRLEKLTYQGFTSLRVKRKTPIDATLFVQLPVKDRKNRGEWLNVMWDENVAVNLLATDPCARIQAKPRQGYHLFQAGTTAEVQLEGVGAALIATATPHLLDRIARVEEDYSLPQGVKSRRSREYGYSYYEASTITPEDADRHIQYAKQCGFRAMDVYYSAFASSAGHFPWRPEYPRGMEDLKDVVARIKNAGILPGIHIHYNKAHKQDAYVTPKPDPRLNLSETFTLSGDIDAAATMIPVEENPRLCTLDDERRILKIQNELITYESYTAAPPYHFENCRRGALGTQAVAHEISSRVGLLDVDTWPIFVRFTQNTSIQEEVAERLKAIYEQAGFQFVYYDGAEDVPPPYWYTVSRAQWIVGQRLHPQPLFAEGACKSHFSWHILTRGNAFDVFKPEVVKTATRAYPAAEAGRAANDFTGINFGWIGYWAPGKDTMGTQPDMLEYVTSRAAAWDCPIALNSNLQAMDAHPRTPDNLEVIRRWEEVRASKWLTSEQKAALRNLEQEHTLLVDEHGNFVLVSCAQVEKIAGAEAPGRAFVFEYQGSVWAAYWHTSGEGFLHMSLPAKQLTLMKTLGAPLAIQTSGSRVKLPLGEKRYLSFGSLTRQDVIAAFASATLFPA